jgi:hypothetical protein
VTRDYDLRRAVNRHYEKYVAEKNRVGASPILPRGAGSLLSRLQATHPCPRTTGPHFVQLPAHHGIREWCCQGCGAIVHL